MSERFQNETGDSERGGEGRSSAGLEILGVVVFLAGCLPGAAVAKALFDGTDLSAEGLGGTAALASTVAGWVGPWPALVVAVLVGVLGVRMVLGSAAAEPLRFVAGSVVSGLGLAAVMSALSAGAGGQLGDGTGGALAAAVGTWAGVLLGLVVIVVSAWLAFDRGASGTAGDLDDFDDDLDGEPGSRGRAALASIGGAAVAAGAAVRSVPGLLRGGRGEGSPGILAGRADRRKRVSTRRRRRGDPVTLRDALTQNDTDGVSLDEAAALAPDDRTLAYMEEVWRRASQSLEQAEPLPPSPYPEDVRLRGEIPPGAAPLQPRPFSGQVAPLPDAPLPDALSPDAPSMGAAAPASDALRDAMDTGPVTASDDPFAAPESDIAPFDFADELSEPTPLEPASSSAAPFAPRDITPAEVEALRSAALREGASQQGPSELPPGVTPLRVADEQTKAPAAAEAPSAASAPEPPAPSQVPSQVPSQAASEAREVGESLSPEALLAGAMPAVSSPPPRPSWEADEDDEPAPEPPEVISLEDVPDVDPGGRWPRRDEALVTEAPVAAEGAAEELAPDEGIAEEGIAEEVAPEEELEDELEDGAVAEADEEEDEDAEYEEEAEEAELEDEDEEEYEYVDEDGNPIDPEDLLDGEYEVLEDGEEDDGEEEEAVEDEYEEYEEEEDDAEEAASEVEEEEEPEPEAGAAEDAEYEVAPDAEENEVVLEPHAAGAAPTPKALSVDAARICEAGRVVVREGRVAVSVLQREFEMEFDEACALLDQLQDEGLIGPYKGGKKREILLTLEQWDERFVAS